MAPKAAGGKDAKDAPKEAGRGKANKAKEGESKREEKSSLTAIAAREPAKPDRAAHDAELKKLRAKNAELMEKKEAIYEERKVQNAARQAAREADKAAMSEALAALPKGDERSELLAKKKDQRKKIDAARETLNAAKKEMGDLTDRLRKERRSADDSGASQFRNVAQVDAAIKESELELECGGGSVNKERRLHGEIRNLKQIKAQMQEKGKAKNSLDGLKADVDTCRAEMDAAWASINALRDEEKEWNDRLDELSKERNDKVKEIQAERKSNDQPLEKDDLDSVKEALAKCRKEMDDCRDRYRNVQKEHSAWWEEYRAAREEARKAEQAARDAERKKWAEEKAKRAKEKELAGRRREFERRVNPKGEEIQMCVTLIDFLCRGQKAEKAKQAQAEAKGFDPHTKAPTAPNGKKLAVMTGKKTENDSSFAFPKKKKVKVEDVPATAASVKNMKAPTESIGAQKKPLKLMMQQTAAFNRVGVSAPAFTNQVAEAVEALQKKKVEFEKMKRSEAEVTKEMDEEDKKKAQEEEKKKKEQKAEKEAEAEAAKEEEAAE